jgi:hypothetical protein
MVKGLLPNPALAGSLSRFADSLRRSVERTANRIFDARTRSAGVPPVPLANTYRDRVLFRGDLQQLVSLFDLFAYKKLTQWRQSNSQTIPNAIGTTVLLQYQASKHFTVTLAPVTGWARAQESLQQANYPRYDNCRERISYEYLCDFGFEGQGNQVVVNYLTTETIDSDGSSKRDLTTHYRAPPLPGGFGDIGELFIAGLRGRHLV